jgi:hypothetical protein
MAYTHAVLVDGEVARSWHLTRAAAEKAAQIIRNKGYAKSATVVPVEKHEGSKATVAKRLAAKTRGEERVEQRIAEGLAKQAELTKVEAPKAASGTAPVPWMDGWTSARTPARPASPTSGPRCGPSRTRSPRSRPRGGEAEATAKGKAKKS